MSQLLKKGLSALAAIFMAVTLSAQVTTSSLGGSVADENGEPLVGAAIIARAIEAPLRKLVNNAGEEAALVIANVKKSTGNNGYNVRTGEYADLFMFILY